MSELIAYVLGAVGIILFAAGFARLCFQVERQHTSLVLCAEALERLATRLETVERRIYVLDRSRLIADRAKRAGQ